MILIPYSKVQLNTNYSVEETKQLLTEKFGIESQSEESSRIKNYFKNRLNGYKGKIEKNSFEIAQTKRGQDIFTISLIGKFKSESDSTLIETKIIFNSNYWLSFLVIFLITGALATGIYFASILTGKLNPAIWNLLEINLIVYFGSLVFYHIKKFRINGLLITLLKAKKV